MDTGSRLAEFTSNTPKPLVQIGGKPIIWHIMKYYSTFGVNEFVLLVGYKALDFVEYFKTFNSDNFDIEIQTNSQEMRVHRKNIDNWSIRIIDTGLDTMTGSRLYRAKHTVENYDNFFLHMEMVYPTLTSVSSLIITNQAIIALHSQLFRLLDDLG